MSEVWRPVLGFEGYYEVSSLGRVRSLLRRDTLGREVGGRVLSPSPAGRYPAVTLKVNGVGTTRRLHVLVAEAFLGPRPDLGVRVDICHNNNDRSDARAENLRYDTHRNNQRQMADDGRGNRARTHCKHGHEFTPENTWHHKARGTTQRVCRACHEARRSQRHEGAVFDSDP